MAVHNKTPRKDIEIHRGAPKPVVLQVRSSGTLQAFTSAVRMRAFYGSVTINLTVGSGITLETAESIANGQATITLTETQSRTVPDGPLMVYELEDGAPGAETPVMMGRLIGVGGYNADD